MESKIKHLEFIQSAINRMAGNSFLLKGWSITIAGALIAATFKEVNINYSYISLLILLFFLSLDSYFLSREGLFRKLYDSVRIKEESAIDFSMHTNGVSCGCEWLVSVFSKTIVLFYGGMVSAHLLVIYLILK